jgi:hypothetical protein
LKVVAAAMFLRLRRFDWNPFLSAPQLPGKRVLPVSVTRLFCFEPRSRIGDKDRGNEKDARRLLEITDFYSSPIAADGKN